MNLELVIAFCIGFVGVFLFTKTHDTITTKICPLKDEFVSLAKTWAHSKTARKVLKEYSLVKIQNGNYGYSEVIQTLIESKNDDKA